MNTKSTLSSKSQKKIEKAIAKAQLIIDNHTSVSEITLKDLYSGEWNLDVQEGRIFGKRFKKLCEIGSLNRIKIVNKRFSDNAIRYKILKKGSKK